VGVGTDDERVAEIREMVRHAHAAGYQVGVHVTGDRGIDTVVDAFAAATDAHPRPDARHYVIHGDFLTPRSMERLAEHGFGANMNPTIKWTIADLEEELVGPERAAYEWPYRDAIDAGVTVASSSDAPVTLPDWRQGIATMLLRESKASGRVSGPDQRITLAEALRTYTANGAWQDFADDWKGTLEAGKVADLCVLGGDLLTADPHDIPGLPVTLTVFGGEIVHDLLTG
ncbi:amidohydrolase family protein, partial [Streptomyces carpinensis]